MKSLFRKKKPGPALPDPENPYRPIYRKPRRVEDIRPAPKDGEKEKQEKNAGPR